MRGRQWILPASFYVLSEYQNDQAKSERATNKTERMMSTAP